MKATLVRVREVLWSISVVYVASALLYTTNYFVIGPLWHRCAALVPNRFSQTDHRIVPVQPKFDNWTAYLQSENLKLLEPSWDTSRDDAYAMSESLFMSKAFSSSYTPSTTIPYYYRASGPFDEEDITITTLITSDRFQVFARLVERYQGPISVTIHIDVTTHVQDSLDALHSLYSSSLSMSLFVDVHLVIDAFDRQFNTWRNIARLFARTDYVLMLDIDFYLCTNFRSAIRSSKPLMDKLKTGQTAFVLPAFEYTVYNEGMDYTAFPIDKAALLPLIKSKKIATFHSAWEAGHNSTDYEKFYAAKPGEVYKVTRYQPAYEPYVVFKADGPPWCDERFVGYGGNKAACLYEMYLSGVSFYVLSDHFLIHQNHLYQEKVRKLERRFNRKIYNEFKEETCLRYLKVFHDANLLNTSRGHNVQEQCKHLKGLWRAMLIET